MGGTSQMHATGKASRLFQLNYDAAHGRYLTAVKEISAGNVLLSEEAFSTISLEPKSSLCSHCYRQMEDMMRCSACMKFQYCSVKCKLSAWKRHHWFECFVCSYLEKMKAETALALRTLLNASFSLTLETEIASQGHILTEIAKQMTTGEKFLPGKFIQSNYLGIYSLQTHATEKEVDKTWLTINSEIELIAKLLAKCIELRQKLSAEEIDKKSENMPEDDVVKMNLCSIFHTLNLHSFTQLEHFDICLWRIFLQKHFKEFQKSESDLLETAVDDAMSKPTSSVACLLERLLMRHALQMRTNGQAIFKIHSTTGSSPVSNLEQQRIATGYFPILSMMNHSCSPNTTLSFDGRIVQVIASRKIRKGEEICHCYGPHFCKHAFLERQALLKRQYFFTCRCKICSEDLQDSDKAIFRMQFHAFKCVKCGEPIKPGTSLPYHIRHDSNMLAKESNSLNLQYITAEGSSKGRCLNEECGKHQSYSNAKSIFEKLKRDCEDADGLRAYGEVKKAVVKFQTILESMQKILYRNHLNIAYVNDQIAQCYVILNDYTAAIPFLTRSIMISGMLYGPESIEIAHEYQKLASLYFNIRSFRLAARYSERVLLTYKMHYGDEKMFPPGADDMKNISQLCQQFRK